MSRLQRPPVNQGRNMNRGLFPIQDLQFATKATKNTQNNLIDIANGVL
jgi:hypothetical protein